MPAAKTKTAAKKAAKKQAANTKTPATKAVKKKAAKNPARKQPSLTQTVNMGPERGDNSWPPSNKAMPNNSSSSPGGKPEGSPAKDSTLSPGGKARDGRAKGKNDEGTGGGKKS